MSSELVDRYREIVLQLYVLLEVTRSASHSEMEGRAAAQALERACHAVLQERGTLSLEGCGAGLLVNGLRACLDLHAFSAVEGVRLSLRQSHVQTIVIDRTVTVDKLILLAVLLSDPELAVVPGRLEEELAAVSPQISVSLMREEELIEGSVCSSALRSVYVAKHLIDCALSATEVAPKYAQETLKGIVDLVLKDGSLLSLLTDLQAQGEDSMRQSARICLLSVITGRRIGLPEGILGELGVAALFVPLLRDGGADELLDRLFALPPTALTLRVIHLACHADTEASDEDVVGLHGLDGGLIPIIVRIVETRVADGLLDEGLPIDGVPLCLVDAFAETVVAAQAV